MRLLRQLGREDWIEAGLAALATGGAAAFRVEPVARGLRVTKGSFYWHFRDRADWRDAVLNWWEYRAFRDLMRPGAAAADGVDWPAVECALRVWAVEDAAVARSLGRVLRERALAGPRRARCGRWPERVNRAALVKQMASRYDPGLLQQPMPRPMIRPATPKDDAIALAGRLSVAPMMDWTDRHCRWFHRLMTRRAMLYTEMVTAPAILHGPKTRLLDFSAEEHPVALQLGGSVPAELASAVRTARDWGYDEINLNCGCPSDRVQSGCFGAVLMETPALVADCVAAMQDVSDVPVTVKCRIGVDEQNPDRMLPRFLEIVAAAGVRHVVIHARKAWLQGLSPKENREIPPLDYPLVLRMKRDFPDMTIGINGGIATLDQARELLAQGLDGVMIGRAAYYDPGHALIGADALWGMDHTPDRATVVRAMLPYIETHLAAGGRLHQVTRHMLGLFHGLPGARGWRQVLSTEASRDGAGCGVVERALARVDTAAEAA